MSKLIIDPRKIVKFGDVGVHRVIREKLEKHVGRDLLPVQKKILALNASGISVHAQSLPRTGKSTAAIVSMLNTPAQPKPYITNLVLAPTPALIDQYREVMQQLGAVDHIRVLYRTGSEEADEEQHQRLKADIATHTLIGTPHRILDYLSHDPSLLPLQNLQQLVIDEVDILAPTVDRSLRYHAGSKNKAPKEAPLETLVDYIFSTGASPVTTIMSSSRFDTLSRLNTIVQKTGRPLIDVAEQPSEWPGEIHNITLKPKAAVDDESPANSDYVAALRSAWNGSGIVAIPPYIKPSEVESNVSDLDAVIARPEEIAGLHIDNLDRIYVLGEHKPEVLSRLQWSMTGSHPHMYIIA